MNKPGEPSMKKTPASPWFVSLGARQIFNLVGIGIFLSVLLIWNAALQQRRVILDEMEQRSILLGQSLSGACSLPYLLGDTKALKFILSRAQAIQDVVTVALLNRDGGAEFQEGDPAPIPKEAVPGAFKVWRDSEYIYVSAPLIITRQKESDIADMLSEQTDREEDRETKFLGAIYLRFSLERTQQLARALVFRSVLATVAIVSLASFAGFLFFRRNILKPIRRLIDAMSAVQRGNLSVRLDGLSGRDEIGSLARTFNDMTKDLHAAEEALRHANAELEFRVKERTRDLQDALQKLKETQEKILRTEKLAAIGKLASGVGHELRNPLGAIQNAIYYIKDALKGNETLKQQDPSLGEFIELAEKEIHSASTIISDLLDFSRVVKLFPEPTDLNALLRDMKDVIQIPSGIHLAESYQEDLPKMMIDAQKMRQVFINLANNAVQAMPSGGELYIGTRLDNGHGGPNPWVHVDFKDTGVGISEEGKRMLFEPLFTTKAKGTGLGLAISHGIVENHGGKIVVQSEVGKGSVFSVQFPLVPALEVPQ